MAKIRPFRAVRPHRDKAHLVGSRSYMNYSDEDLREKLKDNPFTFLHVIQPELENAVHKTKTRSERFRMIKEGYNYFRAVGVLEKDEHPAYYIYRQTKNTDSYTGIIAGISVNDYLEGYIKVHEETITKREKIFQQYLETTGFNAEPVLLSYQDVPSINKVVDVLVHERPEFEFFTTDMVKHEMWIVSDKETQSWITTAMSGVPDLYIADGHHRCASSALLSQSHEEGNDKPCNQFMCMLLPSSQLKISDYNRLIRDLNGLSEREFLAKVNESFVVEKRMGTFKPSCRRNISLYVGNQWYSLNVKPEKVGHSVVDALDARILTNLILKPILKINDLKTDYRVEFMDGTKGMRGLQKEVDNGNFAAAFGLFPVSFEQLKDVSDCGEIMPPKSTYIEPKLRSGLTIYELFED